MLTVEQIRSKAEKIRNMGGASIEAHDLDDIAQEIEQLRTASKDVVAAYKEANPVQTADMHSGPCKCIRCRVGMLEQLLNTSS